MSRPRLQADTIEALDALAIKDESYDTIIWRLLAEGGHVEHDEDEDLDPGEEPEEIIEEGLLGDQEEDDIGLIDQFLDWIQGGREEILEE